jgi:hypothetical protein
VKSKKQLVLAAVASIVLISFAWYQLVWTSQAKGIATARASQAKAAASAKQLGARASQLEAAKSDPTREALLQKLDAAVPASPGLPAYLRWINELADQTQVLVPTVSHSAPAAAAPGAAQLAPAPVAPAANGAAAPGGSPAPVAPAAGMSQLSLTIQASGTYANVLEFLHRLDSAERLIVIDGVSLAGGGANGPAAATTPADPTASVTGQVEPSVTATITAHMYSVNGLDAAPTTGATS